MRLNFYDGKHLATWIVSNLCCCPVCVEYRRGLRGVNKTDGQRESTGRGRN